jgi:hypothetical protein
MQNYQNNISPSYYSSSPPPPVQKKERGVFLTVVLWLSTMANVIATFAVLVGGAAIQQKFQEAASDSASDLGGQSLPHVASRVLAVLAIFQVAQLVSVCGMWAWKRWAVMGYFATGLMGVLGTVRLTGEVPTWSLVWMGVMLLAVFPRLGMFED